MRRRILGLLGWILIARILAGSPGERALGARVLDRPPAPAANSSGQTVSCRVMESFRADSLGVSAVVFHQRDKADGPRLGKLLLGHSGEEVEFETRDARWHRATVVRMKSCFGRGLLLFPAGETKLGEKDDFVLRFSAGN